MGTVYTSKKRLIWIVKYAKITKFSINYNYYYKMDAKEKIEYVRKYLSDFKQTSPKGSISFLLCKEPTRIMRAGHYLQ